VCASHLLHTIAAEALDPLAPLSFLGPVPCAKVLLSGVQPLLMAGSLCSGSGAALELWLLLRASAGAPPGEARPWGRDVAGLLAVVLVGSVLGLALRMWGLAQRSASTSSPLLNLEGTLAALHAWLAFCEDCARRLGLAILATLATSVLRSWGGAAGSGLPWVVLAVVAACGAWAFDNNLTRKVSTVEPVQVASINGFAAGAMNVALALVAGAPWPGAGIVLSAGVLGVLG
jgi:hypothetical protein